MRPAEGPEGEGRGRGARALLPIIAAALVLGSCGLETVTYLAAPGFTDNTGSLSLQDNDTAGTGTRSYEVLYRIYESSDDATAAWNQVNALSSSTTVSPLTAHAQLVGSLGFRALNYDYAPAYRSTYPDPTVLSLSPAEQGTNAQFFFNNTEIPNSGWPITKIVPTVSSEDIVLKVLRPNSVGKVDAPIDDLSQLAPTDPDYSGTDAAPQGVYIVLCAVAISYPDLTTTTYSLPTALNTGPLPMGSPSTP